MDGVGYLAHPTRFERVTLCLRRAAVILESASIRGANFRFASLKGARVSYAQLSGTDLSCAQLQGANLERADLSGAVIQGGKLTAADLYLANLEGADLSGAGLQCTRLHSAQFGMADFSGARLKGAEITNADFSYANLSGSSVWRTNPNGNNMWSAKLQDIRIGPVGWLDMPIDGAYADAVIASASHDVSGEWTRQVIADRCEVLRLENVHWSDAREKEARDAWSSLQNSQAVGNSAELAKALVDALCRIGNQYQASAVIINRVRETGSHAVDIQAAVADSKQCPGAAFLTATQGSMLREAVETATQTPR